MGTDGVSGDEKCGGNRDVDEGVRNCVKTAGRAGEIEAGSVIHGADVPEGGEESFEGLASAAEDAEKKGERWEKKSACKPREKTRRIGCHGETNGGTCAGEERDGQAGKKAREELTRKNVGAGEEERTSAETRFASAHSGPDRDGPHPSAGEERTARNLKRSEKLSDQESEGDDIPPPTKAKESETKLGEKNAREGV